MAFRTGTAADHADLYAALIDFLTADAALVSAGEEWSVVWTASGGQQDGVVLKGPGLAASDSIYVSLRLEANVGTDTALIRLHGMTGYLSAGLSFIDHVNVSPSSVVMFLRTQAMDYWFTANGRRFIASARVSTVYESMYAGFFLPYCLPDQYPYPMFVGGCGSYGKSNSASSWKSTVDDHAYFARGTANGSASGPSAWMLSPQGDWLGAAVNSNGSINIGPSYFGGSANFVIAADGQFNAWGYATVESRIVQAYGQEWALRPITLTQSSPGDQTFGALDGAYHVGGRGQSVENVITVDAIDYIVMQNTFRTATLEMWAMQLGEST